MTPHDLAHVGARSITDITSLPGLAWGWSLRNGGDQKTTHRTGLRFRSARVELDDQPGLSLAPALGSHDCSQSRDCANHSKKPKAGDQEKPALQIMHREGNH